MDDRYRTAIHEAGHAVIGRRLGMLCGHVTILQDEDSAGHSITKDPWEIFGAWEAREKYRDVVSVWRGRIMTFMAGAEAEVVCLGDCPGGDEDDRYQIDCMLDTRHFDLPDIASYEAKLRVKARGLVTRHRRTIEEVATELLQHETLAASDVDILIEKLR